MKKERLEVTCAIISDGLRYFACQRPDAKKHGGKWEFPGGKVRLGEPLSEGIKRELREELNIEVQVLEQLEVITEAYIDFVIRLHPFWCKVKNGEPEPLEHQQIGWFKIEELEEMDFTRADKVLIGRIKKAGGVPAIGEQR